MLTTSTFSFYCNVFSLIPSFILSSTDAFNCDMPSDKADTVKYSLTGTPSSPRSPVGPRSPSFPGSPEFPGGPVNPWGPGEPYTKHLKTKSKC